ncbi:MAG: RidA family protein [Phycisphaerae bacterium]|jgi:enamine deaminase RidA (YjgF/YER057c/UK114 family)
MSAEKKLKALGLALPTVATPAGAYVSAVRRGRLAFTSGQLPMKDGKLIAAGKVPADVPLEAAQAAAAQAVLNALAALAAIAGSIDAIGCVARMNVYVNSSPGFTDQAKVADGASDLLLKIFGDAGRHSRCAVGVAELPLNAPVELDLVVGLGPTMSDLGLASSG